MNPVRAIRQAITVLNSPCREQTRLHSLELDGQLSRSQRVAVRLHLLTCTGCSRSRRQIRLLWAVARNLGAIPSPLPPGVRDRILARLTNR